MKKKGKKKSNREKERMGDGGRSPKRWMKQVCKTVFETGDNTESE